MIDIKKLSPEDKGKIYMACNEITGKTNQLVSDLVATKDIEIRRKLVNEFFQANGYSDITE